MLAQHLEPLLPLPGRSVSPDNWHLTVRFLGDTDPLTLDKLMAVLDRSALGRRFEVTLGEMGAFPRSARANVLWLAVAGGGERLTEMSVVCEEVVQSVGLAAEDRPFAPHLTLSRIRPHQDVRPVIARYRPIPLRWAVTELVLYESVSDGGLRYEPVERFELD